MAVGLNFKKGTIKDIPLFLKFFKRSIGELFSDHYSINSVSYTVEVDYGPKWLGEQLKKRKRSVFISTHKGQVVGYLLSSRSIAGVGFADWLAVDKPYQKKGIASKLLKMWEDYELKEGAHSLFLWTTENNLEFYKSRGFNVGGEFPKAWHGVDTYLIVRNLRPPKEENFLRKYLKSKRKNIP